MEELADIENELHKFKTSQIIIVSDDLGPQERAVIVVSACRATATLVNRIVRISKGIIFVALSPERADFLMLGPVMGRPRTTVTQEESETGMSMLGSVEAREGVTTGISAADRAR